MALPFFPFNWLCSSQTDQGIRCLDVERAAQLSGQDPDYSIKDLFEAIATGNHVRTCMYVCAYVLSLSSLVVIWWS